MTYPPDSTFYQELLSFGDGLLNQTRDLILPLWQSNAFEFKFKDDDSPVSVIDLKCEELARALIHKHYPHHGIIGEEYGTEKGDADFVWTIDPIDGTQNLINRIPTFCTLLGLLHQGKPVLGWLDFPVLSETFRGGPSCGGPSCGSGIGRHRGARATRGADVRRWVVRGRRRRADVR